MTIRALTLAALLLAAVPACGRCGVLPAGTVGTPGQSAYQMAVAGGYVGTPQQWLASLKGDPGTNGTNGTNGANATTTAMANNQTPGLMSSATFVQVAAMATQLAALPTIIRAAPSVAVPSVMLAASTTITLPVPGAAVGGVVTVNCADVALNGSVVYPLPPVTVAGQVSFGLKAVVAITAGTKTFSVSVINP